jgi:hypothetical protein
VSREVDPNNPASTEDFIYLANRSQLPQEWIDANGGDEGVAEIMRGERKVKKPSASRSRAEPQPEPEVVEEEEEEEEPDTESEEE